jgi:hypothetical protein
MAWSTFHAGGDHAATQMVPVSSGQSILLVAYRDGSLIHSLYSQGQGPQPHKIDIAELFVTPPDKEKNYFSHVKTPLGKTILLAERMGRLMEPLTPGLIRRKATVKARNWFIERLNGYDGLGAIFTAMVNAYEAMDCLGFLRTMNSG